MNFDLTKLIPEVHTLKDMGTVLYDKDWQKTADPDLELYYMYRGLEEKQGMRYDITVINPLMLGKEFNKTKGHKHGKDDEVYIVLEGQAIFLIQEMNEDRIEDIYSIKAGKNDICYIPYHSAHFTINPSKETNLKLANWVGKESQFDYKIIQDKQGAGYFYTTEGWTRNENYDILPPLRFKSPLKTFPEKYSFLKK